MTWSGGTVESGFCWVRVLKPAFCSAAIASADAWPFTSGTCTSRGSPPIMLIAMVTTTVSTASAATAISQRPTDPPRSRSTYSGIGRGNCSVDGERPCDGGGREHRGALGVGQHLRRVGRFAAVHPDQVGAHLRGGLVAVVRVLGQRLEHHRVQLGGDAGMALRRRHRILADVLVGHRDRRVTDERRLAGEDFVQHAAQRVDVGAGVDGLAAGLLGGQVLGGADHRGGLRDAVAAVGDRAGDAEVHHLHRAGLADHDVGGLDVAVDDAVLVAEVQRLAGVGDDLDRPAGGIGPSVCTMSRSVTPSTYSITM